MATKVHLFVDQGADFFHQVEVEDDLGNPIDLSAGYTARSEIRKHYYSENAVSFDNISLSNNGVITMMLSAATSSNASAGRYVYDLELIDQNSNTVTRVIEGILTINPEATKGS